MRLAELSDWGDLGLTTAPCRPNLAIWGLSDPPTLALCLGTRHVDCSTRRRAERQNRCCTSRSAGWSANEMPPSNEEDT